MDFDDELSAEDIALLDVEEKNEKNNFIGASKPEATAETDSINQMISDCFGDDDENEPQMEHIECLRSKFKHSSFRAKQWQIIKTLRENRDVCAVMATGYGKSLCFQFTAVYSNKITLVISPLIALMQAQVIDLQTAGISACLVGSAQKEARILDQIEAGRFRVIYSSPEFLQTSNGDKLLSILSGRLALIAVDEAHVSFSFVRATEHFFDFFFFFVYSVCHSGDTISVRISGN